MWLSIFRLNHLAGHSIMGCAADERDFLAGGKDLPILDVRSGASGALQSDSAWITIGIFIAYRTHRREQG
jgi:hypothetical protein